MFRAIKIVGTIVSFLVGSIGTLHCMDKQGQVDPVAVEEESTGALCGKPPELF